MRRDSPPLLGSAFSGGGQCDSAAFLKAMLHRVVQDEREERSLRLSSAGVAAQSIPTTTLLEGVLGCVQRKRVACDLCGVPVDHLEKKLCLELDLARASGAVVALSQVWTSNCSVQFKGPCRKQNGRSHGCRGFLLEQTFLP